MNFEFLKIIVICCNRKNYDAIKEKSKLNFVIFYDLKLNLKKKICKRYEIEGRKRMEEENNERAEKREERAGLKQHVLDYEALSRFGRK